MENNLNEGFGALSECLKWCSLLFNYFILCASEVVHILLVVLPTFSAEFISVPTKCFFSFFLLLFT